VSIVAEFAEENKMSRKSGGLVTMFSQHLKTLRKNAMAASRDTDSTDALWGQ
jgi:hypothetical protein